MAPPEQLPPPALQPGQAAAGQAADDEPVGSQAHQKEDLMYEQEVLLALIKVYNYISKISSDNECLYFSISFSKQITVSLKSGLSIFNLFIFF